MRLGVESYWRTLATTYSELGSPLKPVEEDLALFQRGVDGLTAPLRVLLLGATPSIGLLARTADWCLTAVDQSFDMAHAAGPQAFGSAVCADWSALPFPAHSVDAIIGDGSLNCVRYPDDLRTTVESIRRVLRPGGRLILRCYVQPDERETPEAVLSAMFRGEMPTFHQFKFRLLMALQQDAAAGIAVNDVYEFWRARNLDTQRILEATGWTSRELSSIEWYAGKDTVHTFPTLAEFQQVFAGSFRELDYATPTYVLGERCPVWTLQPC